MAIQLAERGCQVDAVDRNPYMLAAARARAVGRPTADRLRFIEAEAASHLRASAPVDLLVAVGAGALAGPEAKLEDTLALLARSLNPRGFVLFAELIWARPPGLRLLEALGAKPEDQPTFAAVAAAARAAGLGLCHASQSTLDEWDEYETRYFRNVIDYLAENPDDVDAAAMRARAHEWSALYLEEARETFGFGVFVFQAP